MSNCHWVGFECMWYIAFMSCKWETGRVVPQGGKW